MLSPGTWQVSWVPADAEQVTMSAVRTASQQERHRFPVWSAVSIYRSDISEDWGFPVQMRCCREAPTVSIWHLSHYMCLWNSPISHTGIWVTHTHTHTAALTNFHLLINATFVQTCPPHRYYPASSGSCWRGFHHIKCRFDWPHHCSNFSTLGAVQVWTWTTNISVDLSEDILASVSVITFR